MTQADNRSTIGSFFKKTLFIWLFLLALTGDVVLGIFLGIYKTNNQPSTLISQSIRINNPDQKLISPLLLSADSSVSENQDLENKLKLETYDLLNNSNIDTVSVYFKELNSGSWANVGENTEYDPASLLKVPMMIAWYKKAQSDPSILSSKLYYAGSPLDNQNQPYNQLEPHTSYTVDDLISTMITKSDNDSYDLLNSAIDKPTLYQVYSDLGIQSFDPASTSISISPLIYSRFLKILYNSTYLSPDYSEKALELLSQTSFNDGIVAGVPTDITVAHKFGQYQTGGSSTDSRELHDCGIVYYPNNPYLLCVMTRGNIHVSLQTLESVLQTTSKIVYDFVSKNS